MKTVYSIVLMLVAIATVAFGSYTRASESDDQIEASAKDSYVFKTYLKNDDIQIDSKDGAVTLTGTVSDEVHSALAKETVASLPNVKSVNSQLKVSRKSEAPLSDSWITAKVKTNLMFHRNVSGSETEVITKNGIVTLKGHAESEAQRDLTAKYAKDVEGVKSVRNEMTLDKEHQAKIGKAKQSREDPKIDDASITGQIKVSLFSHRSTSVLNTDVKTKDGVVTLGGKASNQAEKSLASELAYDVYGVKNVKNQMTIEKK